MNRAHRAYAADDHEHDVDVRRFGSCLTAAYLPGLLATSWTGEPIELEAVCASTDFFLERAIGGLHAHVVFTDPRQPFASGAIREGLAQQLRRLAPIIGVAVPVVEAAGFAGATLRGVITAMQLVLRPTYPVLVASSIEDATERVIRRSMRRDLDARWVLPVLRAVRDAARDDQSAKSSEGPRLITRATGSGR